MTFTESMTPKPAGLRARAWWLMRERRKFTLNLLLETLANGEERNPRNNLEKYIINLENHGVLVRNQPRGRPNIIWTLALDLGRQPPVYRRTENALWNPNAQVLLPPVRDGGTA